jgi:hypothetical protein
MFPGDAIFRAMVEENGMPKLGASATSLGIRKNKDIIPDMRGMVYPPVFQPGQPNGLSCAPTIQSLPNFALPVAWGGLNKNTQVWRIELSDLGPELVAKEDTRVGGKRHVSIGPSRTMTYVDFEIAIEQTRPKWTQVSKP